MVKGWLKSAAYKMEPPAELPLNAIRENSVSSKISQRIRTR